MDYKERQNHIRTQKDKARKLRKTNWWQKRCQAAVCYYCASPLSFSQVTMDHIVPLSRGGRSTRGNIATACKDCNTAKGDLTAVEFLS